ncbi:MAG: hypothetical protein KBD25_03995 [Rickettsiaceae bacterium]|nr:hypothetical protein [Rickettsiaceae bacterium]
MLKIQKKLFGEATKIRATARCRVVAALVLRGKVISIGHNSYNSCRLARQFSKHEMAVYNHAEINAIHSFLKKHSIKKLQKCTLYVCRAKMDRGKFIYGSSKPCCGCMKAIRFFKIKKVVYV